MKYNICDFDGDEIETGLSLKTAKEKAKEYAKEEKVFVTWYRSSDSQQGYLNENGDHEITGKPWGDINE